MIGFFFKKAFFDGWDNLFTLVLLNLGFILLISLGVLVPGIAGSPEWIGVATAVAALAAGAVWWSTCVFALNAVADFGSIGFADVLAALKKGWAPGLQLAVIGAAAAGAFAVGIPFYLSKGGAFGVFAAGLLFWFAVILVLSLQYYVPLRARLGGGLRKNLRKCIILFFDNPLFSFFLFSYNVLSLVLSVFLAFLLPGFAGVALASDVALRLRMHKYDWIEAHPDGNRRRIPWDELLAEDRELVGTRTLKGMIFPWKE
jgi:hypothetical protein